MKKQIYNLGLVVILSLGVLVNAQEAKGKVGVNKLIPQATLDVQPSASNLTGTTNEGIIAPKLTKERVADILSPVEGTLVYVTDNVYSGKNTKVSKIDDKGYYYYDGNEWVKSSGESISVGATNGLKKDANNIKLGGALTENTLLNLSKYELRIAGGATIVQGDSYFPLRVNSLNSAGGGIAIYPNDFSKRVELSANENGDFRIWANSDRINIKRWTGYVGIGTNDPSERLDVSGNIKSSGAGLISSVSSPEGGYIELQNPTKVGDRIAQKWRIYNMTGNYHNTLQFYAYSATGNLGNKLTLSDDGNMGLGTEEPKAKLDINGDLRITRLPNGTSTDKVLIIDNDGYVKKIDFQNLKGETGAQGASGVVANGNGTTYDKSNQSVNLGGALTEATTINQDNKNLTFTTGKTGQFVVEGTSNMKGAQYVNIRVVKDANFILQPTDYMINYKGGGGNVTLPDAADSTGRVVCFYNYDGGALATGAQGNAGNIQPSYGGCIISDGTEWITKNAY